MANVKTLDVRGVPLEVDLDWFGDVEVFDAMAGLVSAKESGDEGATLVAASRWMHAVLGARYGEAVKALRAASPDGIVTAEALSGFCSELLEAANAKN